MNIIATYDNITGINDFSVGSIDEWIALGTPTFLSSTTFSLAGNQTSLLTPGRRIKSTNSGGTIYSTITSAAFTTVTTVTVVNDSGVLDSGMSDVSYSLLGTADPAMPPFLDVQPFVMNIADTSKRAIFSVSSVSPNTTVSIGIPNKSGIMAMISDQTGVVASVRNCVAVLTAAGTSVTYTASQIVVATTVTGKQQLLTAFNKTLVSAGTGAGGMDTGTLPASAFVSIYAIATENSVTTSIIGANAVSSSGPIYSGASMPAGFIYSGLIGIWPTNSTPAFIIGCQMNKSLRYVEQNIFTATTGVSPFTSQSISVAAPAAAKNATGNFGSTGGASLRQGAVASDSAGSGAQIGPLSGLASVAVDGYSMAYPWSVKLTTPQTIFWRTSENTAIIFRLGVTGYDLE